MQQNFDTVSPLHYWARKSPNCFALSTQARSYSWQQLEQAVLRYVATLQQQGIAAGDVVTCVARNGAELVFIYLACMEIGAVCAITMPQPRSSLKSKLVTLYAKDEIAKVWFGNGAQPYQLSNIQLITLDEASSDKVVGYRADGLASIIFTSGSTGAPKAVAHTHQQHLASAQGLLERFSFTAQDTWLLSLPMYHVSGLAIIYRWLLAGAGLKVGSGELTADIQGVTHASLVATQLSRLLATEASLTLSHVLLGGSHVPLALSQQAAQQGIETWLGYGMTEAASTVTAKQIDAQYSAGRVLPRRQIELRNGRIFIAGDTLASGYYQQGELTPIVDPQGWFDSKDLGVWLDNQELVIKGRADNQFISGGENIHCEEIEQAINAHSDVQLALVVAVQDAEFGARPIAFIDTSVAIEKLDLSVWLAERLVKFKHPSHYFALPQSLQTGGIKVSRSELKAWVSANTDFTVI